MTALRVLEEVIDRSGVAARIEVLLPSGVRPRQLLARTLLPGMPLVLADHRPAHLTRIHQALTALPAEDQATSWPRVAMRSPEGAFTSKDSPKPPGQVWCMRGDMGRRLRGPGEASGGGRGPEHFAHRLFHDHDDRLGAGSGRDAAIWLRQCVVPGLCRRNSGIRHGALQRSRHHRSFASGPPDAGAAGCCCRA